MLNPKKRFKKMKKFILSLGLILMALNLTNCAKFEEATPAVETKGDFVIYASTETRTANDGLNTVWSSGDDMSVFHAVTDGKTYTKDGQFKLQDVATGQFKGSVSGTLDAQEEYDWYAMYPYSSYVPGPANTGSGYMTIGCSASATQTQTGNNSLAHVAGKNYPLVGKAYAVPANQSPALAMTHVATLLEFEVTNSLDEAITVSEIKFTAPSDLVGTFYIDFDDIDDITVKSSGDSYTSKTATLIVNNGEAIEASESAKFYLPVAPFTAEASDTLAIEVKVTSGEKKGTFTKEITLANATSFVAGKIKNVKVNYNAELVEAIKPSDLAYQLVTDVNDLQVGDYVIIAAKSANYALSTDQKSNNRGQCAITKTGDYAIVGNDVQYLTLEEGTVDGTFAFYTGSGYLYAASSDSNYLKTQTKNDANSSWTITISNGTASVVANGSNSRKVMQYNGTSALFACYSSASQSGIALYKGVDASNIVSEKLSSPEFDEDNFALNAKSITLVWNAVANAQKYLVTYNNVQEETTVNSITISNLEPKKEYTFYVTAIGDGVFYTDSDTVSIKASTIEENTSLTEETKDLSFSNKAQRTSFSTSEQVWKQNGIIFTNKKASSSNNVADYANPVRLYAGSSVTVSVEGATISKIVFDCNSTSYANTMKASIGTVSGASVSQSGDKVTVAFGTAVESYTVAKLTGQVRLDKISVTYLK